MGCSGESCLLEAACLESRRSRVQTPLWQTNVSFPRTLEDFLFFPVWPLLFFKVNIYFFSVALWSLIFPYEQILFQRRLVAFNFFLNEQIPGVQHGLVAFVFFKMNIYFFSVALWPLIFQYEQILFQRGLVCVDDADIIFLLDNSLDNSSGR